MKLTNLLASLLFIGWQASAVPVADPATAMSKAATEFLHALDPEQRAIASFDLNADERKNWNFVPIARKGLSLKEMTEPQRVFAHALVKSGLSQRGYGKVTNIIILELVLFDLENKNPRRNSELYYISVFGTPDPRATWGWRVEGHHLSVNVTVVEGKHFSMTPSFLGSNPGEVQSGPHKGLRVLDHEEDLARQLFKSFSKEQKKVALFSTNAPREIITGNSRKATVLEIVGLPQSRFTREQTAALKRLIDEYLGRARPEIAVKEWARIEAAGLEKIYFAWAGGEERGQPHYYRIQGPTFLLEYDNTQNNANHVHAVWRDFQNDFGEDILRQHHEQSAHK